MPGSRTSAGKHPWRPHETTKGCNPTGSCTARVQEDDDIAGSSALLSILLWFPAERVTELNHLWKRMAPEHFQDSFQVQPHTFFDSVTRIMPLVSLVLPRPNFGRRLLIEWGKQEPLPCKPDSQSNSSLHRTVQREQLPYAVNTYCYRLSDRSGYANGNSTFHDNPELSLLALHERLFEILREQQLLLPGDWTHRTCQTTRNSFRLASKR